MQREIDRGGQVPGIGVVGRGYKYVLTAGNFFGTDVEQVCVRVGDVPIAAVAAPTFHRNLIRICCEGPAVGGGRVGREDLQRCYSERVGARQP